MLFCNRRCIKLQRNPWCTLEPCAVTRTTRLRRNRGAAVESLPWGTAAAAAASLPTPAPAAAAPSPAAGSGAQAEQAAGREPQQSEPGAGGGLLCIPGLNSPQALGATWQQQWRPALLRDWQQLRCAARDSLGGAPAEAPETGYSSDGERSGGISSDGGAAGAAGAFVSRLGSLLGALQQITALLLLLLDAAADPSLRRAAAAAFLEARQLEAAVCRDEALFAALERSLDLDLDLDLGPDLGRRSDRAAAWRPPERLDEAFELLGMGRLAAAEAAAGAAPARAGREPAAPPASAEAAGGAPREQGRETRRLLSPALLLRRHMRAIGLHPEVGELCAHACARPPPAASARARAPALRSTRAAPRAPAARALASNPAAAMATLTGRRPPPNPRRSSRLRAARGPTKWASQGTSR